MHISVLIPSYNPNLERLSKVLTALQNQTLSPDYWELIIVDNNSTNNTLSLVELGWIKNLVLLKETRQGLTYSRICGFKKASADIIVMVDDDNLLDKFYLENIHSIFKTNPSLGAIGGKSIPVFESAPPSWLIHFYHNLALRDLGDEVVLKDWANEYPTFAPIGAGMGIRKAALKSYLDKFNSGEKLTLDRTKTSLASGGDNDIILEILKSKWQLGYFPQLKLEHLIPPSRMTKKYLQELVYSTNKSWVLLLESHKINPWKKISTQSLPFRKIKSFFSNRAWRNQVQFIKWRGCCGLYDGLSSIND